MVEDMSLARLNWELTIAYLLDCERDLRKCIVNLEKMRGDLDELKEEVGDD